MRWSIVHSSLRSARLARLQRRQNRPRVEVATEPGGHTVGKRPHVRELDLELGTARPRTPPHPAEHHHAVACIEEVVRIGPRPLDLLLIDLGERPHTVLAMTGSTPRYGLRQVPLDVMRDVAHEFLDVLARHGLVDAPQRSYVVLVHRVPN